jgi:hypothetical protein
MRHRFLAVSAFLYVADAAIGTAFDQQLDGPVVIGETVRLESKLLKESRTLLVAKPARYDGGTERYPVLYLLDAESHFQFVSAMEAFLADVDHMPNMLVVGIASGDSARRTRDLTPPSMAEMDNRFSPGGGGADAFISFLSDELIPFVENTYRTRPYRLLVEGIEGIHSRFREAGQRFGYPERTTPPFTVSLVVAALINARRLEDAAQALLHNPKDYPPAWNQLEALARRYESRGDTEKVAQYYRLSLERNPQNELAKKKLAEMGAKSR